MEMYLGQITLFAGNFAPRGYALCQGQLYSIAQNTALFSILGTTYGGNGQSTFALPNLIGRVPVQQGPAQGGLSNYVLGQQSGVENTTLTQQQMPMHVHQGFVNATSEDATVKIPVGAVAAATPSAIYGPSTGEQGASFTTGIAGGSQPFSILQPYLALQFIICVEGLFPSRN